MVYGVILFQRGVIMAIDPCDVVRVEPFVPASKSLPEITVKGVFLGILLAILLAASSTFVGLKFARTIAGSIPAALISMMILRRFKNSNILENNMVQTIASAGESVAAGVIFTIPALIMMGYWQSFNYVQTAAITVIGGVLGVMFSVPLRRSMIIKDNLPYPEGLATGELLKAGEDTEGSTHILLKGSLFASFITFLQGAFKVAGEQLSVWTRVGSSAFGVSIVLSPVMMAAGYIVGIRALIAFVVGGVLTWGVGIPLFVSWYGLPEAESLGAALASIQKANFRYIGVGVLAIGGVWGVISLLKPIVIAIKASFCAMNAVDSEFSQSSRTDRDLPFKHVLIGIVAISIPIFILFLSFIQGSQLTVDGTLMWPVVFFATLFSLLVGFVASAIAAYIVGIVGTTSLPTSGITISAIIAFASILLMILSKHIDFHLNTAAALEAGGLVIIFAGVICVAASVSGDNMQDLKAGQIVGSTPWKQQLMLIVGTVASALVIPVILQTTLEAYGIGDILPRAGMDPAHALPAPQSTLMATVAKGFFAGNLPWPMLQFGAGLGVLAILLDEFLKRIGSNVRFPVLLFALGIYFPLGYMMAFLVGGLISYAVEKKMHDAPRKDTDTGLLFASGAIAGEAIFGAILTLPFAYYQSTEIFALDIAWLKPYETAIGVLLYLILGIWLYKQGIQQQVRSKKTIS